MSRTMRRLCYVLFTVCLVVYANAQAAKSNPKAQALLDQMVAAYKNVNAIHLKATMKVAGTVPSEIAEGMPETVELRFERPNKVWLDSTQRHAGGTKRLLIVSDGKNLWLWETGMDVFTITKAPGSFKGLANMLYSLPEFEVLLDEQNPFEDMPTELAIASDMPVKQGDSDVDALEMKIEPPFAPFSTALIMAIGHNDHLLRGMTISGKGKAQRAGKDFDFNCELIYSIVNPNPKFTPADFVFVPPPGVKEP